MELLPKEHTCISACQQVSVQLQAFCKLFDTLDCRGKLPAETKLSLSRITKPKLDKVFGVLPRGSNQLSFVSCLYWGYDQFFICFF